MSTVTITRTYADGQSISASNYNDDRTEMIAGINSINNSQIASDAAIALSKLATGALPTAITIASANIVDGTIVNADINASAAIAASKLNLVGIAQNITNTVSSGVGLTITNSGTGDGVVIAQTGNARAFYIDGEQTTANVITIAADTLTSGCGILSYSNSASYAATTGGLLAAQIANASASGNGAWIYNEGTGNGVLIDQNGNGVGLYIDSESTTAGMRLDGCTGTSTAAPQTNAPTGFLKINIDGTDRYVPYYAA